MEDFIESFITNLRDDDEAVDRGEFLRYCREKNIDQKLVNEWLNKLDADEYDQISIEEFCRVFGLSEKELLLEKKRRELERNGEMPELPDNIDIISTRMNRYNQVAICEHFVKLTASINNEKSIHMKDVAHKMKVFLEENYGRVWQVVILQGSYWMSFAHEPFKSIQFKHGQHICLAWRTSTGV